MKKIFLFFALLTLQGKIIAQADKKFNDLMQKGIKQVHDERKHDAAILTFNEAAKLKPSSAEVYGYRGYTYLEKAELEEYNNDEDYFDYRKNASWLSALKDFDKCIELDPNIASAFYHRGMTYAMNREIKNALPDFNKALQLDPADKKTAEAIKNCKKHFVDYSIDMASDEIDNGIATRTKDNKDSLYRNNMRKALQFCDDAIPYDAENYQLFYYRAKAQYWLNKYELADGNIKKALALNPGNADAVLLQKQIKELVDYVKKLDNLPAAPAEKIIAKNDAEIPAPVIRTKTAAEEPDEVIRNLGTVLQQVVASATDPAKHFRELKGGKMKSRFYRGNTYHSSIELPGALETFQTDFLNNNAHNYYYWYALIDEETKSGLNGNIKARYEAVCNELKLLYPNITPVFSYDDKNYFTMKLNNNVTIKVTYFYSEGYKDLVTLVVIAEHGK